MSKKTESTKKAKTKATKPTKSFEEWYEEHYAKTIQLSKVQSALKTSKSWLTPLMSKIWFKMSSAIRHEALSAIKYLVYPRKVEYTVTIFRINRRRKMPKVGDMQFNTNYAFLYSYFTEGATSKSDLPFTHEYVCIGPTFKSADGEYRRHFIPYSQLMNFYNQNKKWYNEIQEYFLKTSGKEITLQSFSTFPKYVEEDRQFEKKKKSLITHIDRASAPLQLILYMSAWLTEIPLLATQLQPNHLADGYNESMFHPSDVTFYNGLRERWTDINTAVISGLLRLLPTELKKHLAHAPVETGQKIIPLRVREIEQIEDIKHKTWRELHIGLEIGDLVINGVTPSLPLLANWFLVQANEKEIYDNRISHVKLDHAFIASDIVRRLEQARRGTYSIGPSGTEEYLSIAMESLSDTIVEFPIKYAEKELVMSPVALCVLSEYAGRTMADQLTVLKDFPWQRQTLGEFYIDHWVFSKYIFEYIYTLYCLNSRLGIVHGDLHLNNVTMHILTSHLAAVSQQAKAESARKSYVVYNVGAADSVNDIYLFPHHGTYATIIDFSRGFLDREYLESRYPDYKAAEYISLQRKRMIRTLEHEMPEFVKKNANALEALILQRFDVAFKLFTAIDSYRLINSMRSMILSHGIKLPDESMDLMDKIINITQQYLTIEMQRAFSGNLLNVSDIEYPNRVILRECFDNALLSKITRPPHDLDAMVIVDYFCAENPLKYSANDPDRFPVNIRPAEIEAAGYPITGYKGFAVKRVLKLQKTEKPQQAVMEISDEIKSQRAERRGTPTDAAEQKKYIAEIAKDLDADMPEVLVMESQTPELSGISEFWS